MSEHYTDIVKEAIYCYEQSTSEKYEENAESASAAEARIFELFEKMTNKERWLRSTGWSTMKS